MFLLTADIIMNNESNEANNSELKNAAKLTWGQKSYGLVGEIENRVIKVIGLLPPTPLPRLTPNPNHEYSWQNVLGHVVLRQEMGMGNQKCSQLL